MAEGTSTSSSYPKGSTLSRGPGAAPIRRKWADSGAGPEADSQWQSFDIGRPVRALKVSTPAQARLSLIKLHLRWWHAGAATMHRILQHAGVPKEVLNLLPGTVHTCASCRAWAKPTPASVASAELADRFNQQVEVDLMFVFSYIIFRVPHV